MRAGHRMMEVAEAEHSRPSRAGKPSGGRGRHVGRRSRSRPGRPNPVMYLSWSARKACAGGEALVVSLGAKTLAVDDAHTQGPAEPSIGSPAQFEGEGRRLECESSLYTSAREHSSEAR